MQKSSHDLKIEEENLNERKTLWSMPNEKFSNVLANMLQFFLYKQKY